METKTNYQKINEAAFSRNVLMFEHNYWRRDEENITSRYFKNSRGQLLIGGVGAGRTLGPLLQKGFMITAVDISPEMIQKAKKEFPQVNLSVGSIESLSYKNESFDYIFLPFHTLAYVNDQKKTLVEMRRLLKQGGILIFSLPNQFFANALIHGDFLKPKRRIGKLGNSELWTTSASVFDVFAYKKIFSRVNVYPRITLQDLPFSEANWKDKILKTFPFIDKSLYFVCIK